MFLDSFGCELRSAGVARDAEYVVDKEDFEWADIIFVMEQSHARALKKMFGKTTQNKKIVCLNIPDNYHYAQPELIELLRLRVEPHILNSSKMLYN